MIAGDPRRAVWELEVDGRLLELWNTLGPVLEVLELEGDSRRVVGNAVRAAYAIGYEAGVAVGRELEPGELDELTARFLELMRAD